MISLLNKRVTKIKMLYSLEKHETKNFEKLELKESTLFEIMSV
jgi:hypothetical protein